MDWEGFSDEAEWWFGRLIERVREIELSWCIYIKAEALALAQLAGVGGDRLKTEFIVTLDLYASASASACVRASKHGMGGIVHKREAGLGLFEKSITLMTLMISSALVM